MSLQKQQRILKKKPEIVVATPGRLWELFQMVCTLIIFIGCQYHYHVSTHTIKPALETTSIKQ